MDASAAWECAQFDDLEALKALVPSKVDPNASLDSPENHIHGLLMAASAHGATRCAEYLLAQGAAANRKNFLGWTALHWAAIAGSASTSCSRTGRTSTPGRRTGRRRSTSRAHAGTRGLRRPFSGRARTSTP